jgi:hypothetical protein
LFFIFLFSPSLSLSLFLSFFLFFQTGVLVGNDFEFLRSCFDGMETEEQRVRIAIQEALHMMCAAFATNSSAETRSKIRELLLERVKRPEYLVRFSAIFYNNRMFPFADAQGLRLRAS